MCLWGFRRKDIISESTCKGAIFVFSATATREEALFVYGARESAGIGVPTLEIHTYSRIQDCKRESCAMAGCGAIYSSKA